MLGNLENNSAKYFLLLIFGFDDNTLALDRFGCRPFRITGAIDLPDKLLHGAALEEREADQIVAGFQQTSLGGALVEHTDAE